LEGDSTPTEGSYVRVYLLNPPYFPHFVRGGRWQATGRAGTLYYPIWLSYAAAVVEQRHKIKLVDAPACNWSADDVVADIGRFKPTLLIVDSSFPSLNNDITITELIKERNSNVITVLVGPPASQFSEQILESPGIDFTARWEYDFTLLELAHILEEGGDVRNVSGISFRENDRILHNPNREFTSSEDLNKIPFVSKIYEKYLNINDYFLGQSLWPEVQLFTGRGCPNRCTFCSWPQTLMGRTYRVRSVSNVLDELEWIQGNMPEVKEVFFEDDTFTVDKKRIIEFTHNYRERGLEILWSCNVRANLDYDAMKEMKKAKCRLLIVGYESGNDIILQNIKKGLKVEQSRSFAKRARTAGLIVHGDFIIGLPGETKETIEATKKLIWEVKPDILQVAVASPFPGTKFYEWCKENGFLLTDDPNEYLDERGHQKAIISYSELSSREMVNEADNILKNYYLSLNYVPIAIRQILRKNCLDEVRRLWRSAKMFIGYIRER
jgi:anaerobic magnesium-protoporphyrin IX monomethyl ester cyclase